MGEYWATIDLFEGDNAKEVLREWYNTSTKSQVRRGDMAGAPFRYVQPILVRDPGGIINLDMNLYDPYQSVWFLFYSFSENGDTLFVLGGMEYWDLHKVRGVLDVSELDTNKQRNRMFFLPWKKRALGDQDDEEDDHDAYYDWGDFSNPTHGNISNEEEEEDDDSVIIDEMERRWFLLPCMFPQQRAVQEQGTGEFIHIQDHISWILRCESALNEEELWKSWDENGGSPAEPWALRGRNAHLWDDMRSTEFWTQMMAGLVGNVFDAWDAETCVPRGINISKTRARWEKSMLFAHHALFMYRMTRYFATEGDLHTLLERNGLEDAMNDLMKDPSPADQQSYAKRFPHEAPPRYYYAVPMEELPRELSSQLPLHFNGQGTQHICYRDVPAWLWSKYMISRTHARTKMLQQLLLPKSPFKRSPLYGQLEELAITVSEHFAANPDPYAARKRLKMVANPTSEREMRARLERIDNPDQGFHVTDMEDIFSAAPCLARLKSNGRFPKHMERLRLVQIFQTAGVSYASTAEFFEQANVRWPHPGTAYRDAASRFNYEAAWKSNGGAVYCGNLIHNSINKPGADVLKCPMVDKLQGPKPKPGQPYDALKSRCKTACAGCSKGGQGGGYFNGPHVLLRRALQNRAQ